MSTEMEKAVTFFCEMLPNYDDLHHPGDYCRLLEIIYLSIKKQEDVPIEKIKELLLAKETSSMNSGTVDSFLASCKAFIEDAKYTLQWAKDKNILK